MCGSVIGHPERYVEFLLLIKLLVDSFLHDGDATLGGLSNGIDVLPVQYLLISSKLLLSHAWLTDGCRELCHEFLSPSREYRLLLLIELLEFILRKDS